MIDAVVTAADQDLGQEVPEAREPNGTDRSYSVRAAERVCDILDLLREHPAGMSLMDLTSVVGLPKSSVFRYLWTLETRQYVERVGESATYVLGSAFLPMHIRRSELLSHIARPRLEELRNTFEETANLGIFDGTRVVYLEIVESTKSMRLSARVGDRDPIHSTALGKAIASVLPPGQAREILEREGMPPFTERTITDPGAYLEDLEQVRRRGYALDDRENELGGRCIAVVMPGTHPPLAISLSAPASRVTMAQVADIGRALKEVAQSLGDELAHLHS
ncbi:MAG TPA: IclR family transcriptional regulator [Thermomicrobiales bacterium]|nr:IclR family transcriptional regulator [Thermomicrobiales bacterium]